MSVVSTKSDYRNVSDKIRTAIVRGTYKPGNRLQSTQELSKVYGVAVNTAQKALKTLEDEGLLVRQKGRGTFISELLDVKSKGEAALFFPSAKHLWGDLTHRMTVELEKAGMRSVLINSDQYENTDDESEKWNSLLEEDYETIICSRLGLARRYLKAKPEAHVICVGSYVAPDFPGDIVGCDTYHTAYTGTKRLLDAGLSKIGCCVECAIPSDGDALLGEGGLILAGFRDALKEAGLKEAMMLGREELLKESLPDFFRENGFPQGFFCNNDYRAAKIADAARELKVNVPEELKLLGVYNTPWADAYQLTSFDPKVDRLAEECVRLIHNRVIRDDKHHVVVRPELVVRESCP